MKFHNKYICQRCQHPIQVSKHSEVVGKCVVMVSSAPCCIISLQCMLKLLQKDPAQLQATPAAATAPRLEDPVPETLQCASVILPARNMMTAAQIWTRSAEIQLQVGPPHHIVIIIIIIIVVIMVIILRYLNYFCYSNVVIAFN